MLITHFNPEYIKAKTWANDSGSKWVATVGVEPKQLYLPCLLTQL